MLLEYETPIANASLEHLTCLCSIVEALWGKWKGKGPFPFDRAHHVALESLLKFSSDLRAEGQCCLLMFPCQYIIGC